MEIEVETSLSNELIASGSTNYSNNIGSSIESNHLKMNSNTFPVLIDDNKNSINNQNQMVSMKPINENQNSFQNKFLCEKKDDNEKKIFDFKFESDKELVSFAGEYLSEMYYNFLLDEKYLKFKPMIGYMNNQKDINIQMRAILLDWLVEVHFRFRLKNETLFQTIWIIDSYLSLCPIKRAKLQLLGIASLLIACKSQEIYYPQLKEFIDITDGAYVKNELIEMENHVLKVLNFNIIAPTSNDFYNIIAKAFNFDQKQYYLGKYFLETALIGYQMIDYPSSVIAASCAYMVMKLFEMNNYKLLYSSDIVNKENPQKIIKDAAREIYCLEKYLSKSTLKAVKSKYSLNQFLNVAQYCEQI